MKKLAFILNFSMLLSILAVGQTYITLPDGPKEFQHVKTIRFVCYPSIDAKHYRDALLDYNVVDDLGKDQKYDITLTVNSKYTKSSYKKRDAGQKLYQTKDVITGKVTGNQTERWDAIYNNYSQFDYSFTLGSYRFGPFKYEVYSHDDSYATDIIMLEDNLKNGVAEDLKKHLNVLNKVSKYKTNSAELLNKIYFLNIDTVLAQGQQIDAQFEDSKKTILIDAVFRGDKVLFDKLIQKKANIHLKDKNGWNAGMYAVIYARDYFLDKLIELGCKLDEPDINGKTAKELALTIGAEQNMGMAIRNGDMAKINQFFANGYIINSTNQNTVLQNAILSDDTLVIDFLIKKGMPIDFNYEGIRNSSSVAAASLFKYNSMKFLLNRKVNLKNNIYTSQWIPVLIKTGFAKYIISDIDNIYFGDSKNLIECIELAHSQKDTSLVNAIASNKKSFIEPSALADYYASKTLDQIKHFGAKIPFKGIASGLIYVTFLDKLKENTVAYEWFLSDEGLAIITKNNKLAMIELASVREEEIITTVDIRLKQQYLEKNPQLINSFLKNGTTLLNYHIGINDPEMVQYLINKGAVTNQNNRHNPFIAAIDSNRVDIVKLLVSNKMDINISIPIKIQNEGSGSLINGYNPLSYAIFKEKPEIVDLLKSLGAVESKKVNPAILKEYFKSEHNKLIDRLNRGEKLPEFINDTIYRYKELNNDKPEVSGIANNYFIFLIAAHYDFKGKRTKELLALMLDKGYKINDNPDLLFFFTYFDDFWLAGSVCDADYDFFQKLITAGAIVEHENFHKNGKVSPLYKCIVYNNKALKIIELLLQNGADPNAMCENNTMTIRQWAIGSKKGKYYTKELAELLKKY